MGSSQSAQVLQSEDDEAEEEEDEDEHEEEEEDEERSSLRHDNVVVGPSLVKKILEQEPEMLPCHASASPLSPQLSTPRIKVWDPYNVLAPPPPPPPQPQFHHHIHGGGEDYQTDVYLISHGECHMNLRPDLVGGRCPDASLTPNGKRQARALAVFLKSQGVRFSAVYASPLDRVRATAVSVCHELNFSEEHIQSSDALTEMSQGHWEGCRRSEIFTPEMLTLIEKFQPDFSAPSGESLRQVEYRMVQFLHGIVVSFPDKFTSDNFSPPDQPSPTSHTMIHHRDVGPSLTQPPNWDSLPRHRHSFPRKKSGKSRLQIVAKIGDHEADDEMSPRELPGNHNNNKLGLGVREVSVRSSAPSIATASSCCVGVFSHSTPIKCLLTGLLGCSPVMSQKICIDDSSVTVLQHSRKDGWRVKRWNDTSHLRLM